MNPILLLHGALGSQAQLESLKTTLKSQGFDVHSLDFSGHGQAAPKATGFTMQTFAADLLAYMDAHNIAKADIFGYSMGGYVALTLALSHPERLGKIFTLGTKFDWTPESSAKEVKMLDPEVILAKVPQFAQQLEARHSDWRRVLTQTAEMMLALGNGTALTGNDLSKITHRVQVNLGTEDNMVTLTESETMAAAMPNAHFKALTGVKHPIEKVDVAMLASELTTFFKG